jgi:hypothetical protein
MKIAVLLHEEEPLPEAYFIWHLCASWRRNGIEVEFVKGVKRPIEADVIFPHVDLSVMPARYVEFLSRYPKVVNRGVTDISKRVVSENLVGPDTPVEGPVIVKTNLNFGGMPERLLQPGVGGRKLRRLSYQVADRLAAHLPGLWGFGSNCYRVYPSVRRVPPRVFQNKALVVERFVPEKEGDLYCSRVYVFLGDQHDNIRMKSKDPVVKRDSAQALEHLPVPEEIVARRRELGFDYGKFDYVVHRGRPILLDANSTPGRPPTRSDGRTAHPVDALAQGIEAI